jgi:hypothetical protein
MYKFVFTVYQFVYNFIHQCVQCLVTYYVDSCKMEGASGCPAPKAFKHKFKITTELPAPQDVQTDPPFASQEIAAEGGQSEESPRPSAGAADPAPPEAPAAEPAAGLAAAPQPAPPSAKTA